MKIIKKILSLSISALGVLVFSGFLSLRPIGGEISLAHHAINHACNDISGSTTPVLSPDRPGRKAGVEDSGRLNFDANPPVIDYQACGETAPSSVGGALADGLAVGGVTGNLLRGWVWDTNLGYVSLNCEGGTNLDGRCGDQNYQTIIASDGQVHGWAWGDNIGWMSMRCRNGKNLDQNCGTAETNYTGVKVAQDADVGSTRENCAIARRGDFYGYSWTETVGWVDFCGAHVELTAPLMPDVTLIPDPTEDGGPGDGGGGDPGPDGIPGTGDEGVRANACDGAVYANGSDSCKIVVQIKEGGAVLTRADLLAREINVANDLHVTELTWNNGGQTTLRADQVTRCSQADVDERLSPCTYNGSILPTPGDFAWSETDNGIMAHVRAIAPTSTTDQIILASLAVQIGDAPSVELSRGDVFSFRPAVEVTRISSISVDSGEAVTDQIFAVRGTSEAVYLTAAKHDGEAIPDTNSEIPIFIQLYDCNSPYEFLFDRGDMGVSRDSVTNALTETPELGAVNDRENIERATTVCPAAGGSLADINTTYLNEFLDNDAATITRLIFSDVAAGVSPTEITAPDAFGIRTRVGYDATVGTLPPISVRYFSRHVSDSSLLNQAADVRGNVRIDVQKIIREGAIAQSLKNDPKDTQSKREKFYRAIKNIINTKGLTPITNAASGTFNFTNNTPLENGLRYFNRTNLPSEGPCKIILNHSDPMATVLNFGSNVTIVGEGCDFFIDQNIISPSGRLGIVALEDLSLTGARRGGNVYICHRVTDLEANIVADGSLFAYGANETDCGADKETLIDDEGLPTPKGTRASARRQLTIIGSLVSNNTYGGAFKSPPLLGDGTLITDPAPAQISKVRLYDINFLRYAHTREGDEEAGEDPLCWANEAIRLSQRFGTTCDANNPRLNGIINIIYRAPAKDMKIFGAVR